MVTEYLVKASRSLAAARALIEDGLYDDGVSRAYYAMFNTMRAAILVRSSTFGAKTHGPTINEFNRLFVKPGQVPSDWGKLIHRAQNARHVADYGEESILIDEAKSHLRFAGELFEFSRRVIPKADFPDPPVGIPEQILAEERRREVTKVALADAFCRAIEERREVMPTDFRDDLVLYGDEDTLADLIAGIDDMLDLNSYVGSTIHIPSLG